jgi:hypothetical protein
VNRGSKISRTQTLIAGAAIATVAIAAPAFAFWTGAGAGTATATLDTPQALTLSPGGLGSEIFPGQSKSVATVASNPNPYPVEITSISLDVSEGTDGYGVDEAHVDCAPMFEFTAQTNGDEGWTVPPKVGSTPGELEIELQDALVMGLGASDSCQGARYAVYLQGDTS